MKLYRIVWMEDEVQQCFIWTLKENDVEMHLESHLGYLPSWWSANKVEAIEGNVFN